MMLWCSGENQSRHLAKAQGSTSRQSQRQTSGAPSIMIALDIKGQHLSQDCPPRTAGKPERQASSLNARCATNHTPGQMWTAAASEYALSHLQHTSGRGTGPGRLGQTKILAKAQLSKGKCSSQHIYSATNQAQQNSK